MPAPKMQPSGFVTVTSSATMQGKLELFGYGFHDLIVNPGDLLIVSTDYLQENGHRQKVEFTLKVRGRDMHLFCDAAHTAELLWNENKNWLDKPMNTPNLDQRGISEIRFADQMDAINNYFRP